MMPLTKGCMTRVVAAQDSNGYIYADAYFFFGIAFCFHTYHPYSLTTNMDKLETRCDHTHDQSKV